MMRCSRVLTSLTFFEKVVDEVIIRFPSLHVKAKIELILVEEAHQDHIPRVSADTPSRDWMVAVVGREKTLDFYNRQIDHFYQTNRGSSCEPNHDVLLLRKIRVPEMIRAFQQKKLKFFEI